MLLRLERGVWLKARAKTWRKSRAYITLESIEGNKKIILNHSSGAKQFWITIDSTNIFEDIYEEAG